MNGRPRLFRGVGQANIGRTDVPGWPCPWRLLISFRDQQRQGPVSGTVSQEQAHAGCMRPATQETGRARFKQRSRSAPCGEDVVVAERCMSSLPDHNEAARRGQMGPSTALAVVVGMPRAAVSSMLGRWPTAVVDCVSWRLAEIDVTLPLILPPRARCGRVPCSRRAW
jgi:hypothetical protein